MMDRRKFFGMMIGGVAAAAAVRTWPFRIYSFPSKPRIDPARIDLLDLSHWGLAVPENAEPFKLRIWGQAFLAGDYFLLQEVPLHDGKQVDFNIPAGSIIYGVTMKTPTNYVGEISLPCILVTQPCLET